MKAFVFGAWGQVGLELVRLLGSENGAGRAQVDITDADAVESQIGLTKPEVVFNCAAYNAVDRAESEPDAAFAANADGPHNIATACRRHGVALVHFSTNYVFDGESPEPYLESDEPAPLSVYGRSKLEGERRVLEAGSHVLVVRSAAVFGGPASFPARIIARARAGEKLRVVTDQTVNPTYARDLAAAAVDLATRGFAGIVHAFGDGCCAWDEFARVALAEAGVASAVESVRTGAHPTQARRPANGCLASIRYQPLRPWREAVREWVNNP